MVYTPFSRIVTFFSFVFCVVPLYSADQVKYDSFIENLAFSLVARCIDDPVTLVSLSYVNKGIHRYMGELHAERCNEFKNYLNDKQHGINPDKVAYTPDRLRAYYLGNDDTKQVGDTVLILLSHYGNAYKKEVITNFANLSFYTSKLAERFKPRVVGGACYMYDAYVEEEKTPGTFVRVLHTGKVEYVHTYCTFCSKHAPSGWIADFLPKMHDELINNATCTYYPWDACAKGDLKKIKKDVDKMGDRGDVITPYTGVIIFDGNSLASILPKDKEMLYCMIPEIRDSLDANGLVGVSPDSNNSGNYLFTRSSLMHMHMSWGTSDAVAEFLHVWKPVCYKVQKYGEFTVHPFTEKILFKPYVRRVKRVKNGAAQFFFKKQKPTVILQAADKKCRHTFEYLEKKKAFEPKGWLAHGKGLSKMLRAFYDSRYTFAHNDQYLLMYDTIRSGLYVIRLAQDKIPTLQLIPNIKEEDYALTSSGYTVEYQPDSVDE